MENSIRISNDSTNGEASEFVGWLAARGISAHVVACGGDDSEEITHLWERYCAE